MSKIKLLLITLILLTGCSVWPFKQDPIVKHPDAPMLIMQAKGKVKVAIYYSKDNKMIEYGWIDLGKLEGFSMRKFDWESYIKKKSKEK